MSEELERKSARAVTGHYLTNPGEAQYLVENRDISKSEAKRIRKAAKFLPKHVREQVEKILEKKGV